MKEEQQRLYQDMQYCIEQPRTDNMMRQFIHIYTQLDANQLDKKTNKLKKDIDKFLSNSEYMRMLDLFYMVYSGEEGRLLLDPTVADEALYGVDNYRVGNDLLYNFINNMKTDIITSLGRIKKSLGMRTDESW